MPLDQLMEKLKHMLSPTQWVSFFSCFISGYLIHLFAFTNLIPNSDGLSRVFDYQQMTVSGRWFLHYASSLNGFTQMPALIGFLTMLLLSCAAVVVVTILELRGRTLSSFVGIVLAATPCLGYTFLYMFTVSAYSLSILLATLAVLAVKQGQFWWLLGSVSLAFSMGIYQAYAAFAISLSLLAVLVECMDPRSSFSSTLRLGLRLLGMLALGAALYYLMLQVFLSVKNLELLDYLGISETSGGYPISQLPNLILDTYKQVVVYFFLPNYSNPFTTLFFVILNGLMVLFAAVCLVMLVIKRTLYRDIWRICGILVMVALLPLGMGFAQIISPFSTATPIMKYAYVCAYLAALLMVNCGLSLLPRPKGTVALSCGLVVVMVCLTVYQANINNLLYTASAQAHRATLSYATRLLSRIESCEGYTGEEEILIIGSFPTDRIYSDIESYALVDHYSLPMDTVAPLNKHIYYYLNDWLNVPIEEPDEETMISMSQSKEFQKMPLYPAQGSVAKVDGKIVVKIQEEYTPKSDYELAYEKRR